MHLKNITYECLIIFFLNGKILVYKIYGKFVKILNPNTILAPNVLNSQGVVSVSLFALSKLLLYLLQEFIYCHGNKCDWYRIDYIGETSIYKTHTIKFVLFLRSLQLFLVLNANLGLCLFCLL